MGRDSILPTELLSKWVGVESGLRGIFIGTIAGGLAPGGPYVSLPLVAGLLRVTVLDIPRRDEVDSYPRDLEGLRVLRDSLLDILDTVEAQIEEVEFFSSRRGRYIIPFREIDRPLTLPRRSVLIRPYFETDIWVHDFVWYFDYWREQGVIMADIVISPHNRLDIRVFPFPCIEFAVVSNYKMDSPHILRCEGFNLSIGACIDRVRILTKIFAHTYFEIVHHYYTKVKVVISEKTRLNGNAEVFINHHVFYSAIVKAFINKQWRDRVSGFIGIGYRNKQWEDFIPFHNKIQGQAGIRITPVKNASLRVYVGPGASFDKKFILEAGGHIDFMW